MRMARCLSMLVGVIVVMGAASDAAGVLLRVPLDQPTISAAIAAAGSGDTILLSPGTYPGNLTIDAKSLTLIGDDGPATTTISDTTDRCLTIVNSSTVTLEGITFTGKADSAGGAIYVKTGAVTLRNCRIVGSEVGRGNGYFRAYGGGLYAVDARISLFDCAVTGNAVNTSGQAYGGGLYCINGKTTIRNCAIGSNTASAWSAIPSSCYSSGGGAYITGDSVSIFQTSISGNSCSFNGGGGGGLYLSGNDFEVYNCRLVGNSIFGNGKYSGGASGGGAYIAGSNGEFIGNCLDANSGYAVSGDGYTSCAGGGLYLSGGNNTVTGNIFWANTLSSGFTSAYGACGGDISARGGGCYLSGTNTIRDNIIAKNTVVATVDNICPQGTWWVTSQGGGGYFANSTLVANNTLANNAARTAATSSEMFVALFVKGVGGGCYADGVSTFQYNVISACQTSASCSAPPESTLCSTTSDGSGVNLFNMETASMACNLYYANTGGSEWAGTTSATSITTDPLLCDTLNNEFEPQSGSPCGPEGNACGVLLGALRAECRGPKIAVRYPVQNALHVPRHTAITVTFDIDVDMTSVDSTTFKVTTRQLGRCPGIIMANGLRICDFYYEYDFPAGDVVTVEVTSGIRSSTGIAASEGAIWSFVVETSGTGFLNYWTKIPLHQYVEVICAADLDGDRDADLIAANNSLDTGQVLVAMNDGGIFTADTLYQVGTSIHALCAADFNDDGAMDLATANALTNDVSLLLNTGTGELSSAESFSTGAPHPRSMAAADFNGDGWLDLATANDSSNHLCILLNASGGTISVDSVYEFNADPRFWRLTAVDLNNDDNVDLIATNAWNGNAWLLTNDGHGVFSLQSSFASGGDPRGACAADYNSDGYIDIAVANGSYNTVSVLLNDGKGGYGVRVSYSTGVYANAFTTCDIDGDRDLDLLSVNHGSNSMTILFNDGEGAFGNRTDISGIPTPEAITAADFDNDGDVDVAVVGDYKQYVTIFRNEEPPRPVTTVPAAYATTARADGPISVTFDFVMDTLTAVSSTFLVNGSMSGIHLGTFSFADSGRTITLTPTSSFYPGEIVSVTLTTGLSSQVGLPLAHNYSWAYTVATQGGAASFPRQVNYSTDMGPRSICAGKFNADDYLDLAVACDTSNTVQIFYNDQGGNFASGPKYTVGTWPYAVATADFDRDGNLDLATANRASGNVTVLFGNGDGTFGSSVYLSTEPGPWHLCPVDLDGDGLIDLAVANHQGPPNVSLLRNTGGRSFAPYTSVSAGAGPRSVFGADMNADGFADLVVANTDGRSISLLPNNGATSFTDSIDYNVDDTVEAAIVGDFDGNGVPDLAASAGRLPDKSNVWIFLNGAQTATLYPVGNYPRGIGSGDFNGDGALDITTADWSSNGLSILLNHGDGTFGADSAYAVVSSPFSVCSADLDNDGDLDLVTANHNSRSITVFYNKNSPPIALTVPVQNALDVPTTTTVAVTFSTDMDVATVTDSSHFLVHGKLTGKHTGTITYTSGTHTATFTPGKEFTPGEVVTVTLTQGMTSGSGLPLEASYSWSFTVETRGGSGLLDSVISYATGVKPYSVIAADLDGDGDLDMAAANSTSTTAPGSVSIFRNNGSGTFARGSDLTVDRFPYCVIAADYNDDGCLDLTTANWHANTISVFTNQCNGSFHSQMAYTSGTSTAAVVSADFDGDGHIDIAAADFSVPDVEIHMNDGFGAFPSAIACPVSVQPHGLTASDLDNDGDIDIAAVSASGDSISVLLNKGNGQCYPCVLYPVGDDPLSICAGDFDGDGDNDLATANFRSDNVSVLLNSGFGIFPDRTEFPVGNAPHSIYTADLDGDGDLDLATANDSAGTVTLLYNDGDGNFARSDTFATSGGPKSVFAADLDGDGDMDIMTCDTAANTVSILRNRDLIVPAPVANPGNASPGVQRSLSVSVNGDPDQVLLRYRVGGESTWRNLSLTSPDTLYTGWILGSLLDLQSIQYFFEVRQGTLVLLVPDTTQPPKTNFLRVVQTNRAVPGLADSLYQMIGFPFEIDGTADSPAQVFEDDLGHYDKADWRCGRWDPILARYAEYPNIGDIRSRRGYWLHTRVGTHVGATGLSMVPRLSPTGAWYDTIALDFGWNQIASPMPFAVAWSDRDTSNHQVDPVLIDYVYYADSQISKYESSDVLEPFRGYFLHASEPTTLVLPYREMSAAKSPANRASAGETDGWRLNLAVRSGGAIDDMNTIGTAPGASSGRDGHDFHEPPCPMGRYVSLAFCDSSGPSEGEFLAGDFRSPDDTKWEFHLVIRGNTEMPATLAIDPSSTLPSDFVVILMDTVGNAVYPLAAGRPLEIPGVPTETGARFRLLVGDSSSVAAEISQCQTRPDEFAMYQNYPNPFNATTTICFDVPSPAPVTINIYNLLGQRVTELVNQHLPAGRHVVRWNGCDADGRPVGSGVYFYRMKAGIYTATRKMAVLK